MVMYTVTRWLVGVNRSGGRTPHPRPDGGLTYVQGPHVTYEIFFPVF